jgi:uncharacterized damage-inducible protein DinB
MMAVEMLRRTAEYDYWANKTCFDAITAAGKQPKAEELFGHILNAQRIWHARIAGLDSTGIEVFPAADMTAFGARIGEVRALWEVFLAGLNDGTLTRFAPYRTTTGAEYSTAVGDVVNHVFLHSAYHRGQIALVLRSSGAVPPATDFIAFARL